MSAAITVLLLVLAVAQGDNCVGPFPDDQKNVVCLHVGITDIPVLPAGAVTV